MNLFVKIVMILVRVTSDYFCAGVVLDDNYNVVKCAPILKRRLPMIIKLVKVKDVKNGKHEFKEIVGKKANGTEYNKRIPVWSEDLINRLAEFGAGEFIELKYDSSKFKNVSEINEADGFPEQPTGGFKDKPKTGGGFRSNGTSRGEDTNRSAAIYLARNVMEMKYTKKQLEAMELNEMVATMEGVAEHFRKYISDGALLSMPGADDGALDPPTV